jgi:general stress protein 26
MARAKSSAKSGIAKPTPVAMSPGYRPKGTKTRFLAWSFADDRLRRAHNYWLCTTRSDRRPHAVPVWGLWLDRAFYFSTDPSSQKARNLAANSACVVHVESGDEVVMLEGTAATCELSGALDRAYARKYGMHLIGFPAPMVVFRVQPSRVQAWKEKSFASSSTCWQF